MNQYFRQIVDFVQRLPMQQRLVVGGVVLGAGLVLGSVAWWANQPDYALLFGNLDQSDAGQVVENLKGRGENYELRDNGTSVFVPRENVYELRLALASSGVVTDGQEGYELFDKGTLGMTDFMQRISERRAMEGELVRTINSLRQVEATRVHLVKPERSPFRETQVLPSASVLLKLSGNAALSLSQVEGIASLVAGAVEGLESSEVTVLDTRGNVLSTGGDADDQTTLSTTQMEMQESVENTLVEKGQSMLDDVVGVGNAIVRISAALDFSRTVSQRELIDPETATVVSEEKIDEQITPESGANSSIRNYEMSRTTETHEKAVGSIDYLTVSVILNQHPVGGADDPDADEPADISRRTYSANELQNIEELVKNAVGYNEARGDQFAINQWRFENNETDLSDELEALEKSDRIAMYMRYGLIALALVMAFLLIRKAGQQVTDLGNERRPQLDSSPANVYGSLGGYQQGRVLPTPDEFEEAMPATESEMDPAYESAAPEFSTGGEIRTPHQLPPASADLYADKLENDARLHRQENPLFDRVRQLVDDAPEDAAAVLRDWMSKDLSV